MKLSIRQKTHVYNFWLIALLGSLFFPLRKIFLTEGSFSLGIYSDFTTASLYSSDLLVLAGLAISLIFRDFSLSPYTRPKFVGFFIIWAIIAIFFGQNALFGLNIYYLWVLLIGFVSYGTIASIARYLKIATLAYVFAGFCALEVLIALYQFAFQGSLGLGLLGESQISLLIWGIARVATGEIALIRAYGTFPHANVLAAFLSVNVIICTFLYIYVKKSSARLYTLIGASAGLVGLVLTSSRAGILSCVIGIGILAAHLLVRKLDIRKLGTLLIVLALTATSTAIILKSLLIVRANVLDQGNVDRVRYSKIALDIISESPFLGVGPGSSLLHMKQFSLVSMQPWEIQPIHNYYLLVAAEFGVIGLVLLIGSFISISLETIKHALRDHLASDSLYKVFLVAIFSMFLVLMLFDHYFYTLEQPRLLLFMVLGLIYAASYGEEKIPASM